MPNDPHSEAAQRPVLLVCLRCATLYALRSPEQAVCPRCVHQEGRGV